jgi:hypothetical protein
MRFIPIRGPLVASAWVPTATAYTDVGLTLSVSADSRFVAAVSADGSEILTLVSLAPGRHCHSTLPLTVVDCHRLSFLRGVHSNLAVIAAIFCRNDSVAPG